MIPWHSIDNQWPIAWSRVLVYGVRNAPDGPYEIDVDTHQGYGIFSSFDAVTHWCYLEEIETPA